MTKSYVIRKNEIVSRIVKNSKFIAYSYSVDNVEQIENILLQIRQEHPKAKHIVYAYIMKNTAKYTDDKEPNGTAGKAIYNLLIKENYTNVLAVVVRYFGGTLLGTGLLTRTYQGVVNEALTISEKQEYVEYEIKTYMVSYEQLDAKIREYVKNGYEIVEVIKKEMAQVVVRCKVNHKS